MGSGTFAPTTPENLYAPSTPYKVTVVEAAADPILTENGVTYARLHVISGGADSAQGLPHAPQDQWAQWGQEPLRPGGSFSGKQKKNYGFR